MSKRLFKTLRATFAKIRDKVKGLKILNEIYKSADRNLKSNNYEKVGC